MSSTPTLEVPGEGVPLLELDRLHLVQSGLLGANQAIEELARRLDDDAAPSGDVRVEFLL